MRTTRGEEEAEANAFAMYLLVPDGLLEKERLDFDINDDKALKQLADKFRVPIFVMSIRLAQFSAKKKARKP
jgi:Zn-dependent peptidase ImmA (M78 family)